MENPNCCAARHPETGEACLIVRGQAGFTPVRGLDVAVFNRACQISDGVVVHMIHGALHGWDADASSFETPWGRARSVVVVKPGILAYSTRSHGGYWLSPDRLDAMPADWLAARSGEPSSPWFETGIDWCLVALAHPHAFSARSREHAARLFEAYFEYAVRTPVRAGARLALVGEG